MHPDHLCSCSKILVPLFNFGSLNTSPHLFLCQNLSPPEGKWDHNLNVSVLKTMPAECYSVTALMAVPRRPSDHRCACAALHCFEHPLGPVRKSQLVKTNVPDV